MAKTIPLTQGEVAIVDDKDFEYLMQWKWYCARKSNGTPYAVRRTKKGERGPKRITVWMHREINGTPSNLVTDHINHNTLDNRRGNLRSVTNLKNQWNRGPLGHGNTGFRGVSYRKNRNKYQACIRARGIDYFLGNFDDLADAIGAYMTAKEVTHE